MGKHLILAGGGHAHLTVLKRIKEYTSRGHTVTLVSPASYHDYSGMGPGLLSGEHRLAEVRFNIRKMALSGGGRFHESAACRFDAEKKELYLEDGTTLGYDILSFNTGSRVTLPAPKAAIGKTIFPVKPIANLFHARQKILDQALTQTTRLNLLVVGGGPAGCEIAGNLQALVRRENISADITLIAGPQLLNDFPESARARTRKLLAQESLRLLEGVRVETLTSGKALLDNEQHIEYDIAFIATGIRAGEPLPAGGLDVNRYLQSEIYPEIFGGGDCINFTDSPLDKVGVYAVRQNPILHHNLLAALEGRDVIPFEPQRKYLLILNLGLNRAVATWYGKNLSGFGIRHLKAFLDHQFLKKFQQK